MSTELRTATFRTQANQKEIPVLNHARSLSRPTVLLLALGASVLALTGCSTQDAVCGDGDYPVAAVGHAGAGDCVSDGDKPSDGYVRYPEGKVPKNVGDKWDTYWMEHALDAKGREIKGSDPTDTSREE
ncbi:SCO0607 family lipoprotein [Streptomyces sp. NPDC096105]|uniref:SCO0607 family lipoprotein n=1 Tax=Streptomyces sp. NPDC096105 TaxID=3366074 RepID=UPI0037F308B2